MSIDLSTVQTTVVWVLVAIALIGLLGAILLKKLLGKLVVLVLAAVLVLVLWQQRQHVLDVADQVKATGCGFTPTFLGIQVSLPASWCAPS